LQPEPTGMTTLDLLVAASALLVFGMIWLRTRLQYARRGSTLHLERAGWIYFGSALGLIGLGWLFAPIVGMTFWRISLPAAPTILRIVWFLAIYYLFIIVHQMMKAGGLAVFSATE
jgi:hypothetical protein